MRDVLYKSTTTAVTTSTQMTLCWRQYNGRMALYVSRGWLVSSSGRFVKK